MTDGCHAVLTAVHSGLLDGQYAGMSIELLHDVYLPCRSISVETSVESRIAANANTQEGVTIRIMFNDPQFALWHDSNPAKSERLNRTYPFDELKVFQDTAKVKNLIAHFSQRFAS